MAVRTYAPRGQTPVLRVKLTRDHLSAIGGLTPEGRLFMQMQDHAYNAEDVVRFLRLLLRKIAGNLLVIWDGSPIHRSQVIKDFLKRKAAKRLHVERLPGYAPELNPTSGRLEFAQTSRTEECLLSRCASRGRGAPACQRTFATPPSCPQTVFCSRRVPCLVH